ncbi:type II toxin-antitoxin system VapB family antitoxin [Caulobacter sp. B11]|uniref:type II toxin-antitoxin system VapB family antitoxin n=1 Tax=Caulobacter sp. B11 TaxID=2048899 RepID=UPI000C12ABAE|nr:type II toxin-antitoxin system VapB family antitoxin [Caulobacter sp. B11]
MGILIKNPEAERAVRELAELTGESLTTAVEIAVRERLAAKRSEVRPHRPRTVAEMDAITKKYLTRLLWRAFCRRSPRPTSTRSTKFQALTCRSREDRH